MREEAYSVAGRPEAAAPGWIFFYTLPATTFARRAGESAALPPLRMVAKSVEETLAEWDTDGCTLRADSSIPIEPGSVLILRVWPSGEIGVGDSVYAPRPATCGMTDEELARAIAAALTDTDLVVVNEAVDHSPFYARDAMQTLKRRGRLQSLAEWFLNGVEPEDQRPIMFTAEHDSDASAEDESVADSERQSELFHTASDFGVRVMEDERTPSMRRKKSPACNIDESPLRLVAVLLDVAVDTEARTVVKVAKRRFPGLRHHCHPGHAGLANRGSRLRLALGG